MGEISTRKEPSGVWARLVSTDGVRGTEAGVERGVGGPTVGVESRARGGRGFSGYGSFAFAIVVREGTWTGRVEEDPERTEDRASSGLRDDV